MGKRLGEYTKENTKCMLPVNGVRLIDRAVEMLRKHGISKLVMVVGYKAQNVKDYLIGKYEDVVEFKFIDNVDYEKTNNIYSLWLAKDELCKDETILLESDLIFDEEILDLLIDHPDKDIALVAKYETWMDGTMVRIDENRNVINFVPKEAFRFEDVDHYYKTVNIYKFSKEFSNNFYVPFLDAYCKVMGNNEYYEQVLRILLHLHNCPIKALPIGSEKWYEIDDKQDLDIAEAIFADEEHLLGKYYGRYGGFWRFPQMMDFCYLVNPYFQRSKLIDELANNFRTLVSEYPSGMKVNSLLASKCWGVKEEYIIPGNGAAELIKALMECTKGKVGIIRPTFEEYPNRLSEDQIETFLPCGRDFRYSSSDIVDFFSNHPISTLLLVNPDNPSGNFIPKEGIHEVATWCEKNDIRFILDESFVDFSDDYANNSFINDELLEQYPHMCVMKSISKSYGVPGLRLGILCSADVKLVSALKKQVSIWNINSFAEYFMQIYNKYEKDYKRACEQFVNTRKDFVKELEQIPYLHVMPSQANFVFAEVLHPYKPSDIVLKLMKNHDILLSSCSSKKGLEPDKYMRIAVKDHGDNNKLIEALKELI